MANPLQLEQETYNRKLPTMLSNAGKYVLIKGDEVIDFFDSYEDALKSGYTKFKLDPFFVKQISPAGQILHFTREIGVACPA